MTSRRDASVLRKARAVSRSLGHCLSRFVRGGRYWTASCRNCREVAVVADECVPDQDQRRGTVFQQKCARTPTSVEYVKLGTMPVALCRVEPPAPWSVGQRIKLHFSEEGTKPIHAIVDDIMENALFCSRM
jgi:hypothetical protein